MGALSFPSHDGDIGWQQWLGNYVLHHHALPKQLGTETFTATGSPWIPQEWALSIAVAWFIAHDRFWILAAFSVAAAAICLLVVAYRAYRRGASAFGIAVAVVFAGFALLPSFGVRAQVFGWFFLSAVLLLLDLENDWIFLAAVVIALWANVHASALIAPVIVGAWATGTWIEDRAWTPRVERNFVLVGGSLLAVCMTPMLWHLPAYAMHLQTSAIRSAIQEWQPADLFFSGMEYGLLPLLAICCYFGIAAPRERWRDGMLFAVAAIIGGLAIRHIPLAALIVAPMAAQRLSSAVPVHARVNTVLQEHFSEVLIFVCSAAVCGVIVLTLSHSPQTAGVTLPKTAIVSLAKVPGVHNLYCEDFAWCSVALEEPNLRTFIDGRCDPFPARVWSDYLTVGRVAPAWSGVLKRWDVDSVLVNKNDALSQALTLRRDWHLFYRDRRYELFLRQDVRTAER
jgi:hypothetical protein